MIQFNRFVLDNGLRVIVHEDHSTPMAIVNVLYDVGSRDENPNQTGFAHLFEHLMFGGSINIPNYDDPLQRAGGENNVVRLNGAKIQTTFGTVCLDLGLRLNAPKFLHRTWHRTATRYLGI